MPSIAESVDSASIILNHPLHQTILLDYVGGTNPIYVGWAKAGSGTKTDQELWRIIRITWDGNSNPTAVEWAAKDSAHLGDNLYRHIWDDRASLTYS